MKIIRALIAILNLFELGKKLFNLKIKRNEEKNREDIEQSIDAIKNASNVDSYKSAVHDLDSLK